MKKKIIKISLIPILFVFVAVLIYLFVPIKVNYDYIGELLPSDICYNKVTSDDIIDYYLDYYASPPVGLYGVYYYSCETGSGFDKDDIIIGGKDNLLKRYLEKINIHDTYYVYSYGKPLYSLKYKHISRFYKNSNYNKTNGQKYLLEPIYKDDITEPKLFLYRVQQSDIYAYDYKLTEPHYPAIKVAKPSGLVDYYRNPYDILYQELDNSIKKVE